MRRYVTSPVGRRDLSGGAVGSIMVRCSNVRGGGRLAVESLKWPCASHPLTVVNMARRTGASARTLALTKAQEAVAQRDAERIKREKQLEAALADFYQAQGDMERIYMAAEAAAAPFEARIREAVRSLDRLGETKPGIAGLTGLSLSRVRDCLADDVEEHALASTPAVCPGN